MKTTDIEQALRDRPGDRELWLDYADLLEARGDTRGTLIRLEQRRDRTRPADRGSVHKEIDNLAAAHQGSWDTGLPEGATVLARHHGFATKVAVEWSADAPVVIEQVLREPFVTALRISPTEEDEDFEFQVAHEQAWDEWSEIEDGADPPQETDAPKHSEYIDPGALATLDFSRLTELGLSYLGIGALGAKALAASAFFHIGTSGAGQAAATGRLDTLDLRYSRIGNDGVAALAASPGFCGVRRLHLQHNKLTAKAASALHGFTKLTELDLRYNTIGEEGVRALLAAPFIGSLQRLLLHRSDTTDAGAQLLAQSPQLPPALRSYWRNA
ncbi:hypothetical protein GCM10027570_55610 [Streptomonospora sediminis]